MPAIATSAQPATLLRYREIVTPRQLHELFRLRYEVYQTSGHFQIACNQDELDIDSYDLHSRFLGAYHVTKSGERLVGGVRMVYWKRYSPLYNEIQNILASARDHGIRELPARTTRFPAERGFDLSQIFAQCEEHGWDIVEFSRTVCAREYRGLNVGSGLVNGIFGMALQEGIEEGIGAAPPALRDFYIRLGCELLPRKPEYFPSLGSDLYVMRVPLRNLADPIRTDARRFAASLARSGYFSIEQPQPIC